MAKIYKVRTSIDNKDTAKQIASILVSTHASSSVHIKEINSVYGWKKERYDITEYEVEALTTNPKNVETVVFKIHNYKLPEMLIEKVRVTSEFKKWCLDWCKDFNTTQLSKCLKEEKLCKSCYYNEKCSKEQSELECIYGGEPVINKLK